MLHVRHVVTFIKRNHSNITVMCPFRSYMSTQNYGCTLKYCLKTGHALHYLAWTSDNIQRRQVLVVCPPLNQRPD